MPTAQEVVNHFVSRCDWVDPQNTVDRVIIGDPDKNFDRCVCVWMSSLEKIKEMNEMGIKFMICHEPTFWLHLDNYDEGNPLLQEKRNYILDNDITIIRNHDAWDRWPEIGIPFAWGDFLGLGEKPDEIGMNNYIHKYNMEPVTLEVFAKQVASKCADIGEEQVQVVGDPNQIVKSVGIGTGCAVNIEVYRDMGCDVGIVSDDGSCYWREIQMAKDLNYPVIRVNHGTSEDCGMITMRDYINENIDGLSAEYLYHGSCFRLVGA